MLLAILVVQVVIFLALVVVILRRPASAVQPADSRLEQLLAADLPSQVVRLDARTQATEQHLRSEFAAMRSSAAEEAARAREDAAKGREGAETASGALRREVLVSIDTLGKNLSAGLDSFRADNKADADRQRSMVEAQLHGLSERMASSASEAAREQRESREVLQKLMDGLRVRQEQDSERLRTTVEGRLDKLNDTNAAKLEDMRKVVDEKLDATLHTRLNESFGQVTEHLTRVHQGLGEMNTLSTGVQDLNRIFSNVKSRGGFAEIQLGKLLEQVLAPGQYIKDARVKKGSQEVVEYAVRFPGSTGEDVLLPIDAKFPREDWERLESAYEAGSQADIESARKAFDSAIRTEGKRICSKYIQEPVTTPYAIMFLPTEGLYAEVLRRDGLQGELHQQCRVMVAGPSNLYALLTSFQLGFRMLNLQKKGNEVWNVLAEAKKEFTTFGGLMEKVEKKFGEVQNTFSDLNTRSRAINRKLRDVSEVNADSAKVLPIDGMLPMLAAAEEDVS